MPAPPDPSLISNPFAILSLIAAPAVLTNSASVLAMSTSNRFLRASERMRTLAAQLEHFEGEPDTAILLRRQVQRIERQAVALLRGLGGAYVALGSFALASLISIVGAALASSQFHSAFEIAVFAALGVGFIGASGLVTACFNLFRATRLSMINITEEAAHIRSRFRIGEFGRLSAGRLAESDSSPRG